MKNRLLPLLAVFSAFSCAVRADEIHLNSVEMPDQTATYYIDDLQNSGEVSGPQGLIAIIDQHPFAITIGDVGSESIPGRVRKDFLLFGLPSLQGKKLTEAKLRLFLGNTQHEAEEKPLPPAWIFHASKWDDGMWAADPRWHGLQTSHFGDTENFSKKLPLCGSADKPGFMELDVTEMIRSDYERDATPVAAFRLEISDREKLDAADQRANTYNFWGPGMLQFPDKVPTLILSFQ